MQLKVIGGTTSDKHLCETCQYGMMRTFTHGRQQTTCYHFPYPTPENVVQCSGHKHKEAPSPIWMLHQALYLWYSNEGVMYLLTKAQFDNDNYLEQINRNEQQAKRRRENPKRRAGAENG